MILFLGVYCWNLAFKVRVFNLGKCIRNKKRKDHLGWFSFLILGENQARLIFSYSVICLYICVWCVPKKSIKEFRNSSYTLWLLPIQSILSLTCWTAWALYALVSLWCSVMPHLLSRKSLFEWAGRGQLELLASRVMRIFANLFMWWAYCYGLIKRSLLKKGEKKAKVDNMCSMNKLR